MIPSLLHHAVDLMERARTALLNQHSSLSRDLCLRALTLVELLETEIDAAYIPIVHIASYALSEVTELNRFIDQPSHVS